MASNINPNNIDGTFPIAGQDNSSQGFRNNFTNVKNNLTFARDEISDLQAKALVTSALTGQTVNNDMAGTQIFRPQLAAWTQSLLDLGAVNTTATLDFNTANFQKVTTAGAITLSFINWPATVGTGALGYGLMRVWIVVTDTTHTITLPSSVNIAVEDIAGYDSTTKTITFDTTGNYVFDISSIDGGADYLIFDVTRNRATFTDDNLYYNPATNSTFLVGFGSGINNAKTLEAGQNTMAAKGSINSVTVGNLSQANLIDGMVDTGSMAGYTVTSLRGNLSANTYTPVQSGDYLGYVNAVTYSGQGGTANVFQQVASMAFFATGSNVTYGLGGNVAFFTSQDGEVGTHSITQALGIENDQSVKGYGNVEVAGALISNGGRREAGTIVKSIATVGGSFTANTNISTLIINATGNGSTPIAWANITLPAGPSNGQRIKIVSIPAITNANINAPAGATIYWVPTTKFNGGNTSVSLTYVSSYGSWYLS